MSNSKFLHNQILRYESMNRYKIKVDNSEILLQHLENNMWTKFESFKINNRSEENIIKKSKELIELWQNEPYDTVQNITKVE